MLIRGAQFKGVELRKNTLFIEPRQPNIQVVQLLSRGVGATEDILCQVQISVEVHAPVLGSFSFSLQSSPPRFHVKTESGGFSGVRWTAAKEVDMGELQNWNLDLDATQSSQVIFCVHLQGTT